MLHNGLVKHFAAALIGVSLCVSSTVASAAPAASAVQVSPMVALSAFGSPVSASAVRPMMHVPNAANLQVSAAATAAAVQDDFDNGVSDWVPLSIILGAFVGVMIFVLSSDNHGHVRVGQSVSPD
jgi:hypothetical protein